MSKTKKPCIANFFIHYKDQVFQCASITMVARIPNLLEKQHNWDVYQRKLAAQKTSDRRSNKTKVEKLKPTSIQVA